MPNRITISFEPCTPAPSGGYDVYYKIKASTQPFQFGGNFAAPPAIFIVGGSPGVKYEGYIQSKCGSVNGEQVPWVMLTEGTINSQFAEADNLETACQANNYIFLFFVGQLKTGTVLFSDLTLQTHYTVKPFLRTHTGEVYSVNQATGQITLVSAC